MKYNRRCDENDRLTMKNLNPDDKVEFVIDAVYALAHGTKQLFYFLLSNSF